MKFVKCILSLQSLHTATIPQNPKYLHNIPDVHFSIFPDQTKLEQVFSTKLKHHMISSARTADELEEDLEVFKTAAKIFCKDIAITSVWKFMLSFID